MSAGAWILRSDGVVGAGDRRSSKVDGFTCARLLSPVNSGGGVRASLVRLGVVTEGMVAWSGSSSKERAQRCG